MNTTMEYKNKKVKLNDILVDEKGLTQYQIDNILDAHRARIDIEIDMENTDDKGELGILAEYWHQVQEELQELWGFPINRDFHQFWTMPKCSCPILDNKDAIGTKYHVYSMECPIHGE